jgi:hypothetical protein
MGNNIALWLLVIVVVVIVLFLAMGDGGSCMGGGKHEKYTRSDLSQDNSRFKRQPVDYYTNQLKNPHFLSNPMQHFQPLDQGPVDLYSSERKLWNGTLFDEFDPEYTGVMPVIFHPNDSKTRFDLSRRGNLDDERLLRNDPSSVQVHAEKATTGEMNEYYY